MTTCTPTAVEFEERERILARLDEALAEVDDLVPLDEARFLETHGIYEGRSDQQQRIIDWFGEEIAPALRPDRPFRVLSVGCGSGMLDVPIATRLASRTADLQYIGVNPNRVECEAFERLFRQASLPGARFEVVPATFEGFETDRAFDLIHFVHCLYYMPDPCAALEKARKLLAPGGRLIVFHAPREALNDLAVRFWDKKYARPTLFSEDFTQLLDRWGWAYERGRVEAAVEVTPFVKGDPDIGLALRDFIVQVDSKRLPPTVQEIVEHYLRLIVVEDRGGHHISHPVDVFFIDG
ncbi:MAG: class I SAM-dependent methyltransferase [Myxococcota bacterium]|nr:class I SAM-dependent methyltransferase [Myxococcota bacterium]